MDYSIKIKILTSIFILILFNTHHLVMATQLSACGYHLYKTSTYSYPPTWTYLWFCGVYVTAPPCTWLCANHYGCCRSKLLIMMKTQYDFICYHTLLCRFNLYSFVFRLLPSLWFHHGRKSGNEVSLNQLSLMHAPSLWLTDVPSQEGRLKVVEMLCDFIANIFRCSSAQKIVFANEVAVRGILASLQSLLTGDMLKKV